MTTAAIIVAAGRGIRAGGEQPKQYRILGGEPVISRAIRAFLEHPRIDHVLAVIHPDDAVAYGVSVASHPKLLPPEFGGKTRSLSVLNGLNRFLETNPTRILVHDAARPLVSADVISRIIAALDDNAGAVPTLPAVDAMRSVTEGSALGALVPRENVARVQTPQGFHYKKILQALETKVRDQTIESLPDEASAAIASGFHVSSVTGDPANFKLTMPEDFSMAERLIAPAIRVGQGFDVHALADGESVTLCGVEIPHDQSLAGHSDADVGLHALTDALLGAVAAGDIGQHFPPSDSQWKGADSSVFLRRAVEIVAEAGFGIGNLDVTLICEQPKIGPYSSAMRARIAEICGIGEDCVSVKATTTESLGFCGRGEGIAAQALATVAKAK